MYFVTTKTDLSNTFNIFSRVGLCDARYMKLAVLSISPKHVVLHAYTEDTKSSESAITTTEIACSKIDMTEVKYEKVYITLDALSIKRFIASTKRNEKVTFDFSFAGDEGAKITYITKDSTFSLDGKYTYNRSDGSIKYYDTYDDYITGKDHFTIDLAKSKISAKSISKKLNWLDTAIFNTKLTLAFISLYKNKLEVAAASAYTLSKSIYTLDKSYTDKKYSLVVSLKLLKKLSYIKDVFTKICIVIGDDYRKILFIKDSSTYVIFSSGQASIYPNIDKAIVPKDELPCKFVLDSAGVTKMLDCAKTCLTALPEAAKLKGIFLRVNGDAKDTMQVILTSCDKSETVLFKQKIYCKTLSNISTMVLLDTNNLIKLLKSVTTAAYKDAKFTFSLPGNNELRPIIVTNSKDKDYIQELTVKRWKKMGLDE